MTTAEITNSSPDSAGSKPPKRTRIVDFLIGGFVLYFCFGLLASIYLDAELATSGIRVKATVLERWQTKAKSKQIIEKAKVEFEHSGNKYRVTVDAPNAHDTSIDIIFAPTLPYYAASGHLSLEPPTLQSAMIKILISLVFSIAAVLVMFRPKKL